MSLGSRMGRSRALATWQAWPLWNSLMEEFQGNATPSNSNLGLHVEWRTLAECSASLLSTEVSLYLSLLVFCYFKPFGRAISPSLISFSFLFFFCKFGSRCRLRGEGREGRGRLGGSWVFGASLDDDPFLPGTKSLRPFLGSLSLSRNWCQSKQPRVSEDELRRIYQSQPWNLRAPQACLVPLLLL